LNGNVTQTQPGLIDLRVDDLPPNTFVELRTLMPAAALAQAPSDGRRAREEILDEERCFAVAANAERARARGEQPSEDCDTGLEDVRSGESSGTSGGGFSGGGGGGGGGGSGGGGSGGGSF
jgi:uncharacterized membrane protein YgcG